jgi:hypothetical protein
MSLIELKLSTAQDPDGTRLRDVLAAIAMVDRMNGLRSLAVHVLALLGVVQWIELVWPAVFPPGLRPILLVAFGAILLGAVWVGVLEYRWSRIQSRLLHVSGARVLDAHDEQSGST